MSLDDKFNEEEYDERIYDYEFPELDTFLVSTLARYGFDKQHIKKIVPKFDKDFLQENLIDLILKVNFANTSLFICI